MLVYRCRRNTLRCGEVRTTDKWPLEMVDLGGADCAWALDRVLLLGVSGKRSVVEFRADQRKRRVFAARPQ